MKKYSIAYKKAQNGFTHVTTVHADNKKDAIKNLAKQIGTKDFYYDKPILECELNMDCENCNKFNECLKEYEQSNTIVKEEIK